MYLIPYLQAGKLCIQQLQSILKAGQYGDADISGGKLVHIPESSPMYTINSNSYANLKICM
jgi:hypothetical protein